jgi:hypothetical protein
VDRAGDSDGLLARAGRRGVDWVVWHLGGRSPNGVDRGAGRGSPNWVVWDLGRRSVDWVLWDLGRRSVDWVRGHSAGLLLGARSRGGVLVLRSWCMLGVFGSLASYSVLRVLGSLTGDLVRGV